MLRIPSPSTKEGELANWLAGQLEGLGFKVELDEVGNVIGSRGTGEHEIMLLGHIDTVPGVIPVRREDNRLFGRGAVDAKGPLAAAIIAVSGQSNAGARFTVIGAVEEEGTSRGARHLRKRSAPDHLVILEPSGWDAITLGYKGSVRVKYQRSQPVGHRAGPDESAADKAIAFVQRLKDYAEGVPPLRPSPQGGGRLGSFEQLDLRVLEFRTENDGLTESAEMSLGFRLPPGLGVEELESKLRSSSDGARLDLEPGDAAVRMEKNTAVVRAFLQGIRRAGGTPRFKMKTGTSDMNVLVPEWKCPALAYGPGDSKLDHTPDEAIDLDEFERGVEVLNVALRALAA
jgi:LysW-gamma-L-lysine carboxypeptidase